MSRNKRLTPTATRRILRQRVAAYFVGGVCLTLTGLSLSHLAHGVDVITGTRSWHSWAMAIGIDLGFVSLEAAELLAATPAIRAALARYTRPAIVATIIGSALLNAVAFAEGVYGTWLVIPAAILGASVPALIYVTARTAASAWLGSYRR